MSGPSPQARSSHQCPATPGAQQHADSCSGCTLSVRASQSCGFLCDLDPPLPPHASRKLATVIPTRGRPHVSCATSIYIYLHNRSDERTHAGLTLRSGPAGLSAPKAKLDVADPTPPLAVSVTAAELATRAAAEGSKCVKRSLTNLHACRKARFHHTSHTNNTSGEHTTSGCVRSWGSSQSRLISIRFRACDPSTPTVPHMPQQGLSIRGVHAAHLAATASGPDLAAVAAWYSFAAAVNRVNRVTNSASSCIQQVFGHQSIACTVHGIALSSMSLA